MTATTSPATGPALPHDEDPGDSFARTLEKICTWGGVAFAVLFGVGFVAIARFVPPLPPSDTAAETLALYRDHTNQIITGLLLCYVGTIGYLLFGSGILGQTRRIKNVPAAIVYLQISCYAAASLLIILPITMWLAAAYRADEWAAESVQLLNDFGWISFVIGFPPFVTWFIATGLAILCDREPNPLYPRWAGFLSILMGFIQVSAVFLPYFKTGAFAWNGLFAWWIPMTDFFLWFVIITVLTLKAINRRDYATTPATSGS